MITLMQRRRTTTMKKGKIDRGSREREHNRNEEDRERDILRIKSRDDNLRGRDLYKNDGDRERHIQPIRSRDNSRERDRYRNDEDRERHIQPIESRDNSRERDNNRNDKKLRIPWSISQQTAFIDETCSASYAVGMKCFQYSVALIPYFSVLVFSIVHFFIV